MLLLLVLQTDACQQQRRGRALRTVEQQGFRFRLRLDRDIVRPHRQCCATRRAAQPAPGDAQAPLAAASHAVHRCRHRGAAQCCCFLLRLLPVCCCLHPSWRLLPCLWWVRL